MLDVEWLDVLLLLYIKSEIEANKLYFKFSNTFCVKTILIRERRICLGICKERYKYYEFYVLLTKINKINYEIFDNH